MQIVRDEEQTSAVEVPQYDPRKKYTWSPDTQFTLSGNDFGILLNSLRQIVSTKEAQAILRAADAADVIETLMAKSVASGSVIEHPEQ
jgi:hypothetical protein